MRSGYNTHFLIFLCFGVISVIAFYDNLFYPIWLSVAVLAFVSVYAWLAYLHRRIGILILFLWIVFALPFIHIVPYLWFAFGYENPVKLWGVAVRPYMLQQQIIELTAMIGAVGGIGFALAISLDKSLISFDSTPKNFSERRKVISLTFPIWLSWVSIGFILSFLFAPQDTIFTAAYTMSSSLIKNVNFSSAGTLSYIVLTIALADAILDQRINRRDIKKQVIFLIILILLVYFQFLRGDRAAIPFALSTLLIIFYWAKPVTRQRRTSIPWMKIVAGGFALILIGKIVGQVRHSLVGVYDSSEIWSILAESFFVVSADLFVGPWSPVLLTPLSVAGDYIYGLLPFKFGTDYINLVLSLPPGFIADALEYTRPLDANNGPAWEMRYGIGGTHASVVPFMNFGMLGVLVVPVLIVYIISRLEKRAVQRINVISISLLATIALVAPHFFWYGEKYGLNAIIAWAILAFFYRISLSFSLMNASVSRAD